MLLSSRWCSPHKWQLCRLRVGVYPAGSNWCLLSKQQLMNIQQVASITEGGASLSLPGIAALVLTPQAPIMSSTHWCLPRKQQLVNTQQAASRIMSQRWCLPRKQQLVPTRQAAIGEYSASSIADHVAAFVPTPQAAIGAYSASSNWCLLSKHHRAPLLLGRTRELPSGPLTYCSTVL